MAKNLLRRSDRNYLNFKSRAQQSWKSEWRVRLDMFCLVTPRWNGSLPTDKKRCPHAQCWADNPYFSRPEKHSRCRHYCAPGSCEVCPVPQHLREVFNELTTLRAAVLKASNHVVRLHKSIDMLAPRVTRISSVSFTSVTLTCNLIKPTISSLINRLWIRIPRSNSIRNSTHIYSSIQNLLWWTPDA